MNSLLEPVKTETGVTPFFQPSFTDRHLTVVDERNRYVVVSFMAFFRHACLL